MAMAVIFIIIIIIIILCLETQKFNKALRSSVMLSSVYWQLFTDILGQLMRPFFKGQAVPEDFDHLWAKISFKPRPKYITMQFNILLANIIFTFR